MTTKRITPSNVTPELMIGEAQRAGLRLMPGQPVFYDDSGPIGVCAATALAIYLDPRVNPRNEGPHPTIYGTYQTAGLDPSFRIGIQNGFDGCDCHSPDPDYRKGFELGRATRLAIGLDAPGGGGA